MCCTGNRTRGRVDALGILRHLLDAKGVSYRATAEHDELYDLLLKAQPPWLDVDTAYLAQEILPEAGDKEGKDLEAWVGAQLMARFRYASKPPRWLHFQWRLQHPPQVWLHATQNEHVSAISNSGPP